jgi:phospholipid transport system transporter-binding protein
MPPVHLESHQTGVFAVHGKLDFSGVEAFWREASERFREQPFLRIDLAGVSRADSAGVALLIEWLREARGRGQDLRFINAPPQMMAIIRVAGLDKLLPFA